MSKRYLCFIIISLLVFSLCIVPPFVGRIKNEANHRGFVVAVEVNKELSDDNLNIYRDAGVNTVVYDSVTESFNTDLMKFYKDKGFNVALRVYAGNSKRYNYKAELEDAIKVADVKYLVLKKHKNKNIEKAPLEDLIEKYNLTLVVSENMNQLQNEMPIGYSDYLEASGGRVMRAYETFKNPSGTLKGGAEAENFSNMIFHHMINSIRDRNTEFFYVNPLEHESFTEADSVKNTAASIKSFYNWVSRLDYIEHKTPNLGGYNRAKRSCFGAGLFFCFAMFVVCAEIIFKKRNAVFEWLMLAIGICAIFTAYFMPLTLLYLYPTLVALMSSCFAFTVTLRFTDYISSQKNFVLSLLLVVLCSLLSLGFGSVVISSMMSGREYYINDVIFRGVKLTLLIPVGYAAISSWIYLNGGKFLAGLSDIKQTFKKLKLWHIAVIAVLGAIGGLYILRSGNSTISPLENQIRNFISEITSARPRTKEFLIGFPVLSLFVYYMKNCDLKLFKWVFASGSSVLFASVTNTFCHVFTDYSISALRTVNGLVFSIPFMLIFLCANHIVFRFLKRR